jgi:nitroreductase
MIKLYHRLEKSMSFNNRNPSSGWNDAKKLAEICETPGKRVTFNQVVALSVLKKFVNSTEDVFGFKAEIERIIDKFEEECASYEPKGEGSFGPGTEEVNISILESARLNDPESFFYSRRSIRSFSSERITKDDVIRAITLAKSAPSACNRQAWHVYYISNPSIVKDVLKLQNGNRGFGSEVSDLLIIAGDLKAFGTAQERNQVYIDSGIFGMSLMFALHSLGLASCALNWGTLPKDDKSLRKTIPLEDSHTVSFMLAVGKPKENNIVCASTRVPTDSILTEVK